jgi:hypothetical protein
MSMYADVAERTGSALLNISSVCVRVGCVKAAEEVYPEFGALSTDARFRLLMSEDMPKKTNGFLYRVLIQLFDSRERRLVSGLAGSRP